MSVGDQDDRFSAMAPFRKRLGTVRFENAKWRGLPRGEGSTSAD